MITFCTLDQFVDTVSGLVGTPVAKDSIITFNQPLLDWMRSNCYGGFSDDLVTTGREIPVEQLFNVLDDANYLPPTP